MRHTKHNSRHTKERDEDVIADARFIIDEVDDGLSLSTEGVQHALISCPSMPFVLRELHFGSTPLGRGLG